MANAINPDIYKQDLIKRAKKISLTFSHAIYEDVEFDPYAVEAPHLEVISKEVAITKTEKIDAPVNEDKSLEKPGEKLNRESIKAQLKNLIEEKKEGEVGEKSESSDQNLDSIFELPSEKPDFETNAFAFKYLNRDENLKVLFVFEELILSDHDQKTNDCLSLVLQGESKTIFERIVKAMKLEEKDYLISWLNPEKDNPLEFALEEIFAYQPKVVVSIGSKSAQLLTKKSAHFTQIRMNRYNLHITKNNMEASMPLLPLFNIELLAVNQRLKKIAWDDLQTIMPLYNS